MAKSRTRGTDSPAQPEPGSVRGSTSLVALLRGVNVGGNKKVPMSELRDIVTRLGCVRVQTYIQSGNLVFSTPIAPSAAELALEQGIRRRFGFAVDVVIRTGAAWRAYAAGTPFADAQSERPHLLHLGLSKRPPKPDAADKLREYARSGERIEILDDAIWIDFGGSVASSKLTPAVLDRVVGSTVTARNWRTVLKLGEMSAAIG